MDKPKLSVIVPVLNEVDKIGAMLNTWQHRRNDGIEIIVVDGGSQDGTEKLVAGYVDAFYVSNRGRACQMNHGASYARGDTLLFLHADTEMPESAFRSLMMFCESNDDGWGFFPIAFDNSALAYKIIAFFMNVRTRLTSVSTGDQCQFVSAELFHRVGRFEEIPLMEDVSLSKRMRSVAKPTILPFKVCTAARRWETKGILTTVLLMWLLRLAYFLGVSPEKLHKAYYR
ncbi:MAG: TIGR04283 family arsenosugar biosynthesis glycosyltransferase [Pseudomonadota bacterium]